MPAKAVKILQKMATKYPWRWCHLHVFIPDVDLFNALLLLNPHHIEADYSDIKQVKSSLPKLTG